MFDRIYKWPEIAGPITTFTGRDLAEELFLGPIAKTDWRPPKGVAFSDPNDDKIFQNVWRHCADASTAKVGR